METAMLHPVPRLLQHTEPFLLPDRGSLVSSNLTLLSLPAPMFPFSPPSYSTARPLLTAESGVLQSGGDSPPLLHWDLKRSGLKRACCVYLYFECSRYSLGDERKAPITPREPLAFQ